MSVIVPYAHQITAHNLLDGRRYFAIFGEQGTGKSKILSDDAVRCFRAKKIDALLITAPNDVHRNWAEEELPKHLPTDINYNIYCWSSKLSAKKRTQFIDDACRKTDVLTIFCQNIEAVNTGWGEAAALGFLRAHNVMWAVDESTRIKAGTASCTKVILKLSQLATARRILSGLPTPREPADIYTQFEFLHPGLLGHKSIYSFKARYYKTKRIMKTYHKKPGERLIPGKDYFDKVTGYANLEELAELVAKHSFRVLKKDCLDLPDKIYQVLKVDLDPAHRALYERAKEAALIEFSGGLTALPIQLTRILRQQQLTGGFLPSTQPDGSIIERDIPCVERGKNAKLRAVMGVIESFDGKAIIWARFTAEVKMIRDCLIDAYGAESVVTFFGENDSDERNTAKVRFQNDPTARYFVATQSAGGIGLTLVAATLMLYYSNTLKYIDRAQSEDRAHRIGQEEALTIVDIVARDTTDERILEVMKDRKDVAAVITKDGSRGML